MRVRKLNQCSDITQLFTCIYIIELQHQIISNKYHHSIVSTSKIMALLKPEGASALFLAAIIVVQPMVFSPQSHASIFFFSAYEYFFYIG
jgi:hypothetical protein